MSRRKPQDKPTLLGPDGKPLDRTKYAPKPEPPTAAVVDEARTWTVTTAKGADISDNIYGIRLEPYQSSMVKLMFSHSLVGEASRGEHAHKRTLADRVNDDLRAVGVDPTATGEAELPQPPADLTTYADAYEAAVRSCPHTDIESTMYAKGEYQCVACGRYLDAEAMRKRRDGSSFWGRYFS